MSFDFNTKKWITGLGVDSNCSVEEFCQKVLDMKKAKEAQGFTVSINNDNSGDECWDCPITNFSFKLEMTVCDSDLVEIVSKLQHDYRAKCDAVIREYRSKNSKSSLEKQEAELNEWITKLQANYEYVYQVRNKKEEDEGIKSAMKGVENAKKILEEFKKEKEEKLNNPKSDEEIVQSVYYLKSFDAYMDEESVSRCLEEKYLK